MAHEAQTVAFITSTDVATIATIPVAQNATQEVADDPVQIIGALLDVFSIEVRVVIRPPME